MKLKKKFRVQNPLKIEVDNNNNNIYLMSNIQNSSIDYKYK